MKETDVCFAKNAQNIAETVKSIDTSTDKTTEKKNITISLLNDTQGAILNAFGTREGGHA